MLRRKPTALTISPEDLTAFDQSQTYKRAYIHFLRTKEDPNGWFVGAGTKTGNRDRDQQMQAHDNLTQAEFHSRMTAFGYGNLQHGGVGAGAGPGVGGGRDGEMGGFDPSDELKPLPGDKARIIRGREERIMGGGGGGGHGAEARDVTGATGGTASGR